MKIDDYIQGMRDCKEGKPHESGHSPEYDRGYAVEYQLEQIMGAK